MSGNDDDRERPPADDRTGEQPPQNRGQQHPQGRQGDRGRQGQRGQQTRQGGRQPQRAGQPAGGRHGSGGGALSDGVARKVLLVAAAFAVAGLAFGLLPALYGGQGESPVQADEQTDTPTPSPEQQEMQQNQFKNQIVASVISISPYIAVGLGAFAGLSLGLRMTADKQELLIVSAAGAGVGAVLFLVLSGFLAIQQAEAFEESLRFSEQVSYQFGTGLMNGIFVGVPTAIAAAGAAYAGDELSE